MSAALNLVVIRVRDLEKAKEFYTALGLRLVRHAHGAGPEHLATAEGTIVLEFYPAASEFEESKNVRIGFLVDDVQKAAKAATEAGGQLLTEPKPSSWGLRAVVKDPFGNKVELVQRSPTPHGSAEGS